MSDVDIWISPWSELWCWRSHRIQLLGYFPMHQLWRCQKHLSRSHSLLATFNLEWTGTLWLTHSLLVPSVPGRSAVWCWPHLIQFLFPLQSVWSCQDPLMSTTPSNPHCFPALGDLEWTGTVWWPHLICIVFWYYAVWGWQGPCGDSILSALFFFTLQFGVDRNRSVTPSFFLYSFPGLYNLEWAGTLLWPHAILIPVGHCAV